MLIPPFDYKTAISIVQENEDAWNTCEPTFVIQAYSPDCIWVSCGEKQVGHEEISSFLIQNWKRRLHYRVRKQLRTCAGHQLAVSFVCEWQNSTSGQWYRTSGVDHWEFSNDGLITRSDSKSKDTKISADNRQIDFHKNNSIHLSPTQRKIS